MDLDEEMWISQNQDGKVFVDVKVSDLEETTDYSNISFFTIHPDKSIP